MACAGTSGIAVIIPFGSVLAGTKGRSLARLMDQWASWKEAAHQSSVECYQGFAKNIL